MATATSSPTTEPGAKTSAPSTPRSTTFATSVSRANPVAALTTPFVPPSKCAKEASRFANTACMPPNWDAYWYGNVGYYSPAVCPQSYAVAASRPADAAADSGYGPTPLKGEMAVLCCPSGYVTVSNSASFCSSAASSAYAVQVRWQSSDIPHLKGITAMIAQVTAMPSGGYSTITATGAPTDAASMPSSSGAGLSTGAKVALGLFVPLIILSLFAGSVFIFLKRRQANAFRESPGSPGLDKSSFHSHASSKESVTIRAASYATSGSSPGKTKTKKSESLAPPMAEAYSMPELRSPSPKEGQSHTSSAVATEGGANSLQPHKPQISLTIPPEAHVTGSNAGPQEHGDTPLLPRAPSPHQIHPEVQLNRSASPALEDYGYSRMQRLSRDDLESIAGPAYVAPLPPPTADRPEPLRIRQSTAGPLPMPRTVRRASSTPSLAPVTEVETEDRYMAPPTTAVGDSSSRPNSNEFPDDFQITSLTAATFPLSPASTTTPYSEMSSLQMPQHIAELEAIPKPLSIKSAKSAGSVLGSPKFTPSSPPRSRGSPKAAPSSPPRSRSAQEQRVNLEIDTLQPPQRSRSALDQSPVDEPSSHSDEMAFRPTTPQALPRVFSQKRTANAVSPRLNIADLPKLQTIPDYAGSGYGDGASGSAVDVRDEEMFRRVQERRMLEDRERRLERDIDARYSWRGAHGGHRPMSSVG